MPARSMALLKSRPKIRVQVPSEIKPGDEVHAVVLLECKREVEIEHVDVVLNGSESWTVGAGESSTSRSDTLIHLGARIAQRRVLPRGTTQLPVRFPLPSELPPSVNGGHVRIAYQLTVHAPIEWWPDARAAFEIHVASRSVASPETTPGVFSSDPEGPGGKEPHVELSLASTWTRVGGVVSGAIALSNTAYQRYSEIKVGLVGVETLYDGVTTLDGGDTHEHARYTISLPAEQAADGVMIPFRFRVPDEVAPEYRRTPRPDGKLGLSALRWELEATVGIRWGGDIRLRFPFRVLPASKHASDAPLRLAPPSVGSDRLRGVWEAVGALHGLRYEAQTLSGRFESTELVIRRDHRGRDGIQLVAELSYPELFLDLTVEPAVGVRRVIGRDVEIGDASWDRDHHVSARDDAQAVAVLRAIVPAMRGARLVRFDDRRLVLAVRDAGQTRNRLERFCAASVALASLLERVRADLPPPTAMRAVVEEWRALARKLNAPLETAHMRIEGELGAHAAEVRLAFDAKGRPHETWLAVRPSSPLDVAQSFRWAAREGAASDAIAGRFRGSIGEIAAVICHEARELHIDSERLMVCLPGPLGIAAPDGSVIAVAQAERRLTQMAQLATLLRTNAGPYR